jgi:hypothetical protein
MSSIGSTTNIFSNRFFRKDNNLPRDKASEQGGTIFYKVSQITISMKNLAYNLNSVEVFYGDSVLTSVIQIYERINDMAEYMNIRDPFTEIKKKEMEDRLDKLVGLNQKIQKELEKQAQKLITIKQGLSREVKLI